MIVRGIGASGDCRYLASRAVHFDGGVGRCRKAGGGIEHRVGVGEQGGGLVRFLRSSMAPEKDANRCDVVL